MKVRKAVIPTVSLGTRFLPATKTLSKEMLPIFDKITVQYFVEEVKKLGVEDHFDSVLEIEQNLKEKGKTDLLRLVEQTMDINIYFIRQSYPRGLGDSILTVKDFLGNEPFVVMLGEDIMQVRSH